jgi:hypothetical protein
MTRVSGARGTHESGGGQCRQVQSSKRQYSRGSSRSRELKADLEQRHSRQVLANGVAPLIPRARQAPFPSRNSALTPPGGQFRRGRLYTRDHRARKASPKNIKVICTPSP